MNDVCTCCGKEIPDDRYAMNEDNEPYNYDHLETND